MSRQPSCRPAATPRFWRDAALPFIEARSIEDGRQACYARHTHESFSIGAIGHGSSLYLNGRACQPVSAGAVVVINPETVHACNPVAGQPWSYRMLHIEAPWLAALQQETHGRGSAEFRPYATSLSTDPRLYGGLNRLHRILTDPSAGLLQKHGATLSFFMSLQELLQPAPPAPAEAGHKLRRAAEFIADNPTRALTLDDICNTAALSPAQLIRAFKRHYGMTPHAYLVDRRIQYARGELKRGRAIAAVALDAGFADQAHFQRAFKRHLAATPGQYAR